MVADGAARTIIVTLQAIDFVFHIGAANIYIIISIATLNDTIDVNICSVNIDCATSDIATHATIIRSWIALINSIMVLLQLIIQILISELRAATNMHNTIGIALDNTATSI